MSLPTLSPMLATPGGETSCREPGQWHFEVKWDGYRALAGTSDGALRLSSRRGLDLAGAYPELAEIAAHLGGHDVVLDGEVVALLPDGRSSFELLQQSTRAGRAHLMLFDLLHLDGHDVTPLPYEDRRALLLDLVGDGTDHVHVPTTFGDDRDVALAASKELQLEGVVAKRAGSRYEPGRRSGSWVKIKHVRMQAVVVVGWTPGTGARSATLGSVLLAVATPDGLRYAGKAGSGFSDAALADAMARLRPLVVPAAPVPDVPRADARGATWVRPDLVGEVAFAEWTAAGRLRQPTWRGWRDDLEPTDAAPEA